jgi:hypothetical protein
VEVIGVKDVSFTLEEIKNEMAGMIEFMEKDKIDLSGKAAISILQSRFEHLAIEKEKFDLSLTDEMKQHDQLVADVLKEIMKDKIAD